MFEYLVNQHRFEYITYTVKPGDTPLANLFTTRIVPLIRQATRATAPIEGACAIRTRSIMREFVFNLPGKGFWPFISVQCARQIKVSLVEDLSMPEKNSLDISHRDTNMARSIALYRALTHDADLDRSARQAADKIEAILAAGGADTETLTNAIRVASILDNTGGRDISSP